MKIVVVSLNGTEAVVLDVTTQDVTIDKYQVPVERLEVCLAVVKHVAATVEEWAWFVLAGVVANFSKKSLTL